LLSSYIGFAGQEAHLAIQLQHCRFKYKMPLQVTKIASSSAKSHFKCNTARIACGIAVSTETADSGIDADVSFAALMSDSVNGGRLAEMT
jgi:hypothetical protein